MRIGIGTKPLRATILRKPSVRTPLLIGLHATAHDSTVFTKNWKTSFAPHQVCHVASNHDGSVIVALTNGGNISLLRARDGQVLATRRVVSQECSIATKSAAHVSFVANAHLSSCQGYSHYISCCCQQSQ